MILLVGILSHAVAGVEHLAAALAAVVLKAAAALAAALAALVIREIMAAPAAAARKVAVAQAVGEVQARKI